jgi:imidazolonepropionase-like amidohydrolase
MRRIAVGSAALSLMFANPLAAQERPVVTERTRPFVAVDAAVVVLTGVRVVDGTGTPARDDQTVVLRGGRIEAVGPRASTAAPDGARVLDLAGHTVIPGLVQLHEHTYLGGLRETVPMDAGAPLYLAFGVTTAMTAGSQLPEQEMALKQAIDDGTVAGPRLHVTGPYITGHPASPPFRYAATPDEARSLVAEWADRGATWFKVMSGPAATLRAVIEEAHARGLRVTGHLCSVSFTEAAEMGIDALQHGFITNSEYVPGRRAGTCPPGNQRAQADVDVESDAVQESIRRIVESGAAVVSTLGVYESFVPGRARLDPRAMQMFDPDTRQEVKETHAALATAQFNVPERLLVRMMAWERAFVAAGGVLGAGSDPWGTGFLPGYGNLRNYELLVEAGFAAEEAIRILTLNGARILGEDDRIGSVEAGKAADLVVIRGDPVRAPAGIYETTLVFRGGVGYDADRLRAAARGRIGRE